MIYLKTIIAVPNEVKFIKLNLKEAYDHIDKFVICEFNRSHVGSEKDYIFEKHLNQFTREEREKICGSPLFHVGKLNCNLPNLK